MVKLLSTIVLILAIILFPPAVLAVISNNAVPGDSTYPIKRILEDGIYAVASLNPTSKAWFSAARSDRRFQELSTLLAQGKSASSTLNELVIQTDITAEQIKKVEDPVKKQELIIRLSESIDKYSQKLDEVSAPQIAVITPISTPTPVVVQPPTAVAPSPPQETVRPEKTIVSTPRPTELPEPSPSQAVSPVTQPPVASINPGEADDAKKKFEEIKKRLEEQKKSHQEKREDKREDREDKKSEKNREQNNKDSDQDKKRD